MSKGTVVSLVLGGFVLGIALGWFLARGSLMPSRGFSVSTRTLLTNRQGQTVGELAPGIMVVSSERLDSQSDLGWFGYIPVYFGTGDEAARILRNSSDRIVSPLSIGVAANAHLPGDLPVTSTEPRGQ